MSHQLPEAITLSRIKLVLSLLPELPTEIKQEMTLAALAKLYQDLDPCIYAMLTETSLNSYSSKLEQALESPDNLPPTVSVFEDLPVPRTTLTSWFDSPISDREIDLECEYSPLEIAEIQGVLGWGANKTKVTLADLKSHEQSPSSVVTAWLEELKWRFFTDKRRIKSKDMEKLDSYYDQVRAARRART